MNLILDVTNGPLRSIAPEGGSKAPAIADGTKRRLKCRGKYDKRITSTIKKGITAVYRAELRRGGHGRVV